MFSTYNLNKKKLRKIILIHGLFSSSGYWLPYISSLKNFNLIVLNIDYIEFLKEPKKNLNKFLNEINNIKNVDIIISHSLGTIIASHIDIKANFINICPVHKAKRINKEKFVSLISSQIGLNPIMIQDVLKSVDSTDFTFNKNLQKDKALNFFPTDDEYFDYNVDVSFNNVFFKGDHFEISNIFKIKHMQELLGDK